MKKYQSYKPSRVVWINEFPSHWVEKQNKHIFCDKKDEVGMYWKDFQLLSLSKKGIIKRDIDSGKGKFPESFESYKKVEIDDLIFCLYDIEETPRSVGLSSFNGMITGSYKIYSCTENSKFIYYWYLTIDDFKGLKPFYTGMRNVVRPETFLSLKIYIPPINEQLQIVKYLDEKVELIDKLISTKERKISLLKEQRTTIINQIVTKGLNPNVKLKYSGVEWIGEIPELWLMGKIKFLSKIISKGTTPSTVGREVLEVGNIFYVKVENIKEGYVGVPPSYFIDEETDKILSRSSLKENDILVVITGSTIGKVVILPKEFTPSNTNQGISFVRLKNKSNVRFVWYWLSTEIIQDRIKVVCTQSTQPNLSMEDLGNFSIPLPSELEQIQIVEYLDSKTKEIDDLVQLEQKKIDLLKEYRQSLISEVVTGKIKVTTDE